MKKIGHVRRTVHGRSDKTERAFQRNCAITPDYMMLKKYTNEIPDYVELLTDYNPFGVRYYKKTEEGLICWIAKDERNKGVLVPGSGTYNLIPQDKFIVTDIETSLESAVRVDLLLKQMNKQFTVSLFHDVEIVLNE